MGYDNLLLQLGHTSQTSRTVSHVSRRKKKKDKKRGGTTARTGRKAKGRAPSGMLKERRPGRPPSGMLKDGKRGHKHGESTEDKKAEVTVSSEIDHALHDLMDL